MALITGDAAADGRQSSQFFEVDEGVISLKSTTDRSLSLDAMIDAFKVAQADDTANPLDVRADGMIPCSWHGPTARAMARQHRLSGQIVMMTGQRNGTPLIRQGAIVCWGNIKCEFLTWEELDAIGDANWLGTGGVLNESTLPDVDDGEWAAIDPTNPVN